MSHASGAIQLAVSDAQERGGSEVSFGNHGHKMMPEALGIKEIVLIEQNLAKHHALTGRTGGIGPTKTTKEL